MLVVDAAVPSPGSSLEAAPRWGIATRFSFRFCVLYFGIYVVLTHMLYGVLQFPGIDLPQLDQVGPGRATVEWTARHVFGVTKPLVVFSGSGDKTFDWVEAFCFLVFAAAGTIVWSMIARRRRNHAAAHGWFRLFLRFSVAGMMVSYGAEKVIPVQMPYPPLQRLLEPFGHFSPMSVLWYSIGASRPYEIFTGSVEMLAGVLLFIPATATLGALVSLACAVQIFVLNMTYDVPVKLFSFHLVLMSLFLLAPDAKRLRDALFSTGPVRPSSVAPLCRSRRAVRIGVVAQVVFGLYLVGMNLHQAVDGWRTYGGGGPRSPLYGIWNVTRMSIDGLERAPLLTDYDRFRRVIFDSPARMSFQRMDDTFVGFGNTVDMTAKTLKLARQPDTTAGTFAIQQQAPDRMVLDGVLDGKNMRMELELFPRERFLLVSRGFNWVQEFPFIR